jgi:hypothetical protein
MNHISAYQPMNIDSLRTPILLSALVANAISTERSKLISALAQESKAVAIAQTFGNPKLVRELKLKCNSENCQLPELVFTGDRIIYRSQDIGKNQILYKSPLPGELQARLAIESAIERFLEYLQKQYQIAILHESDYHVKVFIPKTREPANFKQYWQEFIEKIAFSTYGNTKLKLPGLVQTFIVMLNSIALAGRGFSTLEVPILTQDQSDVLAAWYLAVVREVEKRQSDRQSQINRITKELADSELSDKERKSKQTDLQKKEEMQSKEAKKYSEYFQKSFGKFLEEQRSYWQELELIQSQLAESGLNKAQKSKLQKQEEKAKTQIILDQESLFHKLSMLEQTEGEPFKFVRLDRGQNSDKFQRIVSISKLFTKTATDQINSTRGDIFTQCILEMYRLLENEPSDTLPEPLLSEQPRMMEARSPGDDSKEFCYSCGVALDAKTAKWKVARFMFERPSQRRQSSSSEERPHICASCSALAFASPLKVTDESIILKLEATQGGADSQLKLKDYVRMLTNKEINLSSGRYVILASDRTSSGELASQKLGQVQYALAKVASIFTREVLADFKCYLIPQGSQKLPLESRHLILTQGLMESYGQSIVVAGKEINMTVGDAIRYVEQDLPYFADYSLVKVAQVSNSRYIETTRKLYWQVIQQDLQAQGVSMDSQNQVAKRAKLYRDVTALTGLTYAFVQSLESTAKKAMKQEDAEREVSKIIEKVSDAVAFCYYATLGDEKKTSVQARLFCNSDNYFVYEQTKWLLETLGFTNREEKDEEKQSTWLTLYADDVMRAYTYFSENGYSQERDWNELTYNLKLSLYTRFPELVRKLKSTSEA